MKYFDIIDDKLVQTDEPSKFVVQEIDSDGNRPMVSCTCSAGSGNCWRDWTKTCDSDKSDKCIQEMRKECGL